MFYGGESGCCRDCGVCFCFLSFTIKRGINSPPTRAGLTHSQAYFEKINKIIDPQSRRVIACQSSPRLLLNGVVEMMGIALKPKIIDNPNW